jgi:hypothetical protein
MKKCVCGHEMTRHDWKHQWVCHRCGRTQHIKETMTNAERIRSMGNEELARFLLMEVVNDKCYGICRGSCTGNDCISGIVEWLQCPVEE